MNVHEEPSPVLGKKCVLTILYGCFCCYVLSVVTSKFGNNKMQVSWEMCFLCGLPFDVLLFSALRM